jgi:hypothetical protein
MIELFVIDKKEKWIKEGIKYSYRNYSEGYVGISCWYSYEVTWVVDKIRFKITRCFSDSWDAIKGIGGFTKFEIKETRWFGLKASWNKWEIPQEFYPYFEKGVIEAHTHMLAIRDQIADKEKKKRDSLAKNLINLLGQ